MDHNQLTIYKQCPRAFNWHLKNKERKGNVMGGSFTAYAILGVEIDIDQLTNTQMVRGCECELTAAQLQYSYCPKCRALIQDEQDVPIEGYIPGESLFGVDIVFSTDEENAYVGKIVSIEDEGKINHDCFLPIPQQREDYAFQVRQSLRERLGKLFDADKFGMYVAIHCSY